jgi:hypothetical protein
MVEKKGKVHKRLTIAELKNCKGFENYSNEQAEETIQSLEKLSILFYQLFIKEKQKKESSTLAKKDSVLKK